MRLLDISLGSDYPVGVAVVGSVSYAAGLLGISF